jgi:hypothetical protein
MRKRIDAWPPLSPAAANAWVVLVTTRSPDWREALTTFPEGAPTLGDPHPGFFYPDPIGFWAEVRKWIGELVGRADASLDLPSALSCGALVHVGEQPARLAATIATCRPCVVLFLDEAAWNASGWDVKAEPHHVPDPHRDGKVYQGFWGRRDDGLVVGKAPQHPSARRFYAWSDMSGFLRSAPIEALSSHR